MWEYVLRHMNTCEPNIRSRWSDYYVEYAHIRFVGGPTEGCLLGPTRFHHSWFVFFMYVQVL